MNAYAFLLGLLICLCVDLRAQLIEDHEIEQLLERADQVKKSEPVIAINLIDSCKQIIDKESQRAYWEEANWIICTMELLTVPTEKSIESCKSSIAYFLRQTGISERIGVAYNDLAINFDIQGDKDSSIYYFKEAETVFLRLQNHYWLAEVYNNWGVVYSHSVNQQTAIKFFKRARKAADHANNSKALMASYVNLGGAFYRQKFFNKSEENLNKGLKKAREMKLPFWEAISLCFLGDNYYERADYERAESAYKKGLAVARKNQNAYSEILLLQNLGKLNNQMGAYQAAIDYTDKAKQLSEQSGRSNGLSKIYNLFAKIYDNTGEREKAEIALKLAEQLSIQNENHQYLLESYQISAKLAAKYQQYETAYQALLEHNRLNDSIVTRENFEMISLLDAEFESSQKQEEINDLRAESTIQKRFILFGTLFVLVITIFSLVILHLLTENKKLNANLEEKIEARTRELEKSNLALKQFAYIASHDLKTPLRTISGFLTLIKRKIKANGDKDLEELINFAVDGAKRMYQLIADVLEFSKINNAELELAEIDLSEIMDKINDNVADYLQEKKARIQYVDLPKVIGNEGQLYQLFQNLIINGIKYNSSTRPEIKISVKEDTHNFYFEVEDNGIGIADEYKTVIFQMFKRLHNSDEYEGTGIGLALCQKIVENHGGKIHLDSTEGEGSKFTFNLSKKLF